MRLPLLAALAAGLWIPSVATAHPGHAPVDPNDPYEKGELPPAYAASGRGIAYYNTPNRHGVAIPPKTPTVVGKVSLDLKAPADVLVQFSSGIAAETGEGCPCSVRASLRVGDAPLTIVKRINVGAPTVQAQDKYEHDRQPADGSYVFVLPAGKHDIALVMHQVDGAGTGLEAYYVNLQAIPFAK
ncbi:MAG: hypothetical protein DI570_21800 [Phenylobacterium zucineum]|nr:MAG: hypothetical protein DI570_21800 [Phenylobacterium zucineum]